MHRKPCKVNRATQTQRQVLGRAFLQYVFGLEVELVLFAFAVSGGDVVTLDVASHEAQAWHAIVGHVQVVATLPGAFVTLLATTKPAIAISSNGRLRMLCVAAVNGMAASSEPMA